MGILVYFSSKSENTHRFVQKLGLPALRIPLQRDEPLEVSQPYILLTPTYGGGHAAGAVPGQVIHFLNDAGNRSLIRGVIASGNTNFGSAYCLAGAIIARKCGVPHLYNLELLGTPEDVQRVRSGVEAFWTQQNDTPQAAAPPLNPISSTT